MFYSSAVFIGLLAALLILFVPSIEGVIIVLALLEVGEI